MIYEMVQGYIDAKQESDNARWDEEHDNLLSVSEIGHCPRKAMLRINGVPFTNPFDDYLRRLMFSGKHAENKLRTVLEHFYGDMLEEQVRLRHGNWVGKPDFIIPGAVIEHKETGNFTNKRLPYNFHLMQVLMYKYLLINNGYPISTQAWLYYQDRADWAEFKVSQGVSQITYEGSINGKPVEGVYSVVVHEKMRELEQLFEDNEIPPRYETPFEHQFFCTRMYYKNAYPSCVFFDKCWPEHAGKETIPIE